MLVEIVTNKVNLPFGFRVTAFSGLVEIKMKVGGADLDRKPPVDSGSMFRIVMGIAPNQLANFSLLGFGHRVILENFEVEIFEPDGEK